MNPTPQSWLSQNIKSVIALLIVLFSFTYFFLLAFGYGKATNDQVLIAIVGVLTGCTGYYYGYSQGASKKDEAQAELTANSQIQSTTTTTAPITPPADTPPVG